MICYVQMNDIKTKIAIDLLKNKNDYFLTNDFIELTFSNYFYEIKDIYYLTKNGFKPLKKLKFSKDKMSIKLYSKKYFEITTRYF